MIAGGSLSFLWNTIRGNDDQDAVANNDVTVSIPSPYPLVGAPHRSYNESRRRFLRYGLPLYHAALDDDWETADKILQEDPNWMTAPITKRNDTVLHIAVAAMHLGFVQNLVDVMIQAGDRLESRTSVGNTAFCIAASSGFVEIAEFMVKKNRKLPDIRGSKNMTPLRMAILLRHTKMVHYLMKVTNDQLLDDDDRIELLTSAIEADLYDVALEIITEHPQLATYRNAKNETVLHTLSQRPLQSQTQKKSLWEKIRTKFMQIMVKHDQKQRLCTALEVTQRAWDEVIKEEEDVISNLIGYPKRLLFDAARIGNVDFLITLILSYPDLIWKVDNKRRSIFHIAVEFRQETIFKLIHEIGAIKYLIASFTDKECNNMLHLAAKIAPADRLNCVSGAALQMQRELLWFKAVKEVVQPQLATAKNKVKRVGSLSDKDRSEYESSMEKDEYYYYRDESEIYEDEKLQKTPQALFTEEHENLRLQGEEWMKKTAESCTLVATLITTVDFTAAFTLPGGNDESDGSPILLKKVSFKVFAISNAISLFASATSILMFLSILISRYAESDFRTILPLKLMIGLASLFISIETMMAAFTATFFITFQQDSIWIPLPIALLATIPVLLFGFLQFPLLKDIYSSTYEARTLFQPSHKRKLLWQKSKRPKIKLS